MRLITATSFLAGAFDAQKSGVRAQVAGVVVRELLDDN
jgi:hypothetical protein